MIDIGNYLNIPNVGHGEGKQAEIRFDSISFDSIYLPGRRARVELRHEVLLVQDVVEHSGVHRRLSRRLLAGQG